MFKVKNKKTNELVQVLGTHCDEYGKAWFLVWEQDAFRWQPGDNFVPPNYVRKYKWIVAGSRDFQNYPLLCNELDKIKDSIKEIVCGEARGADTLGRTYAYDNAIPIKSFAANWAAYGKSAGFVRNYQMAEYADAAIIFWDGVSPGSKHMIEVMKNLKKDVKVIRYDQQGID